MVHLFKQLLYQSNETVNMHLWLRMARMETDYNLKKLGLTFSNCFRASLKNRCRRLISIRKLRLHLPLDVQR